YSQQRQVAAYVPQWTGYYYVPYGYGERPILQAGTTVQAGTTEAAAATTLVTTGIFDNSIALRQDREDTAVNSVRCNNGHLSGPWQADLQLLIQYPHSDSFESLMCLPGPFQFPISSGQVVQCVSDCFETFDKPAAHNWELERTVSFLDYAIFRHPLNLLADFLQQLDSLEAVAFANCNWAQSAGSTSWTNWSYGNCWRDATLSSGKARSRNSCSLEENTFGSHPGSILAVFNCLTACWPSA
ncbi:hypothetical protein CSKR_201859, partial [Clonorchis sinensis]